MLELLLHSELWVAISRGIPVTLALTSLAMVFGLAFGSVIAIISTSHNRYLKAFGVLFSFTFRAIPLLTLLYFLYYGLPAVGWIRHGPLWEVFFREPFAIAVLAFSLNNAAYLSEALRGGMKSVTKGQLEACVAIGMKDGLALRRVVLPIAFRNSIMTIGNEMVFTLKATSLASAIVVSDVLSHAKTYGKIFSDNLTPYIAAAVFYIVIVALIDLVLMRLKRKYQI
nr:ABC transporter permease subunit [uncultured Pseudomonas sp.]